ncbi:MAG: hypothetical protein H6R06_3310, partial [Proteobacteria bacterium]|nr:hypothetical protein [Pseudomonadota bacterium]
PEWKSQRAGYSSDGTPNNLHVVRSMRGAIGRRIAIGAGSRAEVRELEDELDELQTGPKNPLVLERIKELQAAVAALRARIARIPYLDPIDLRYRSRIRVPVPTSKAVMFCLMDISGSMDEARKDLSKRFFILLYLFLTRHYEKIDLVFIRHHTQAQEVNEEDFFHARETGGTVVSSALVLMEEIIRERYSPSEWNIYGAQASDGDNWHHDSGRCRELLSDKLLPLCRYYGRRCMPTSRCARQSVPTRSTRCSATCSRRKGPRPHERSSEESAELAVAAEGAAGGAVARPE